jgi:hypothetical protein
MKFEDKQGESIHCFSVSNEGRTTTIGDLVPAAHETSREVVLTATQQGTYDAVCQVVSGSSGRTTFTVTGSTPVTKIVTVTVSPASGTGTFEMTVEYMVFMIKDQAPKKIYCSYVSHGNTVDFDPITPSVPEEQYNKEVNMSTSFPLIVLPQADGSILTGDYYAKCKTEDDYSERGAYFTVIEAGRPLTGTITYDEASEVLSPHKNENSYYPSQHHKWCGMLLTFDSAGNISGICSSTGDKMPLGLYGDWNQSATIEGTINGRAVPGGSFTFTETLIERTSPGDPYWETTRQVVIAGTGSFVSPTQATGTATMDIECRTVDETSSTCADDFSQFDSYSGTISWEFNATSMSSLDIRPVVSGNHSTNLAGMQFALPWIVHPAAAHHHYALLDR